MGKGNLGPFKWGGMGLLGCALIGITWLYVNQRQTSLDVGILTSSSRPAPLTWLHLTDPASEDERQKWCERDGSFAWIPTGEFTYGSDRAERDYAYQISAWAIAYASGDTSDKAIAQAETNLRRNRWFDREPNREERSLLGFCLQRNLVTNVDYQAFVQATGHRSPYISEEDYQTQGFLVHPYQTVLNYLWNDQVYPDGTTLRPVVLVSYDDALAYAQWKSQQDTTTYRLPTAEEWEKAARGTDGRYFPWGNEWQDDATNWSQTSDIDSVADGLGVRLDTPGTSAIAHFPLSQSIYGVEDMAGNVFEYTSTLRRRPTGVRSVMKGCSWDDWPGFCRTAYEHTRPVNSRHILFGFRLVNDGSTLTNSN